MRSMGTGLPYGIRQNNLTLKYNIVSKDYFRILPKYILFEIVNCIGFFDIINLCMCNKYLRTKILNNKEYWLHRCPDIDGLNLYFDKFKRREILTTKTYVPIEIHRAKNIKKISINGGDVVIIDSNSDICSSNLDIQIFCERAIDAYCGKDFTAILKANGDLHVSGRNPFSTKKYWLSQSVKTKVTAMSFGGNKAAIRKNHMVSAYNEHGLYMQCTPKISVYDSKSQTLLQEYAINAKQFKVTPSGSLYYINADNELMCEYRLIHKDVLDFDFMKDNLCWLDSAFNLHLRDKIILSDVQKFVVLLNSLLILTYGHDLYLIGHKLYDADDLKELYRQSLYKLIEYDKPHLIRRNVANVVGSHDLIVITSIN